MTDKKIRKSPIQQQNGLTPTTPSTTPAVSNPKVDISVWLKQGTTKDQAKQLGATDEDFNKIDGGDFGGNENGVIDDFEVLLYHVAKYKQENGKDYTKKQAKKDGLLDVFNKFNTDGNKDELGEAERFHILQEAYEQRTGKKLTADDITEPATDDVDVLLAEGFYQHMQEHAQQMRTQAQRTLAIEDEQFSRQLWSPGQLHKIMIGKTRNVAIDPYTQVVFDRYAGADGVLDENEFRQWQNDRAIRIANNDLEIFSNSTFSLGQTKSPGQNQTNQTLQDNTSSINTQGQNLANVQRLSGVEMQKAFSLLNTEIHVCPTMTLEQAQARGLEEEFKRISSDEKVITTQDIDFYKQKLLQQNGIDIKQVQATMIFAKGDERKEYFRQGLSVLSGGADVKKEFANVQTFDEVLSLLGITKEKWDTLSNEEKGNLLGEKLVIMLGNDLTNDVGQWKAEFDKLNKDRFFGVIFKDGAAVNESYFDKEQLKTLAKQKVVQSYLATIAHLCNNVFEKMQVDDNTKSVVVRSLFQSLKSNSDLQAMLSSIGIDSIEDQSTRQETADAVVLNVMQDKENPEKSNVQAFAGAVNAQIALEHASEPVATAHVQAVTHDVEDAAVVNTIAQDVVENSNDEERKEFLNNISTVLTTAVETFENGNTEGQSFEDIFNNTLQTVFPDYVPPASSSSSSSGSTGGNASVNGGSGSGNVADYINYVVNQFNNDPNTSQVANTRSQSAMSNPVIDYNQEQINRIDYVLTRETSDEKTPMWMRYSDAHLKSLQKNQLFDLIADNFDIIKDERIRNKITNYFAQMGKPALINLMMSSSEKVQKFLFKNGYIDFNTIEANIHTSKQMEQLYNSLQDVVREDLTEKARVNYEAGNHLTVLEEMLLMPEDRERIAQKVDDFRHFEQEEEAKKRKEIDV